jgi:ArsR family transcriptional regulator, lead/cadmium/zinc/bismuth-responsive transcriptional repressor
VEKLPQDHDCCEEREIHTGAVRRAQAAMPPDAALAELAALFKALADQTRVRILAALARGELCVCDLADLLDMSQSAISHQLRILRGAKLVRFRRDGKNVFYSLDDAHVLALFDQGLEHVRHG